MKKLPTETKTIQETAASSVLTLLHSLRSWRIIAVDDFCNFSFSYRSLEQFLSTFGFHYGWYAVPGPLVV